MPQNVIIKKNMRPMFRCPCSASSSETARQRKVSAAHQQPDLSCLQTGATGGGREGGVAGGGPAQTGAAQSGGGGSDFFRPRAGSDSRAPGVLGKMASMTRTRWRSGEGQALQPGVIFPIVFLCLTVTPSREMYRTPGVGKSIHHPDHCNA